MADINYTPLKMNQDQASPQNVYTKADNKSKFPMKIAIPTLLMLVIGTGVYFGNMAISQNNALNTKASGRYNKTDTLKKYQIKISPTESLIPTSAPTATPTPAYENLFDEKTQTENPFNENVNPFDNLK